MSNGIVYRRRTSRAPRLKRWDEIIMRLPRGEQTTAVEVGVWRGQTSEKVLSARPLCTLYLVDLWIAGTDNPLWEETGSKMAQCNAAEVEAVRRSVVELSERFAPRAPIIRRGSAAAADDFEDASLDLVFIDADHGQTSVIADISAWRTKVKPGGWLGGHDYKAERFPGVESAVRLAFPVDQIIEGANKTWWVKY